VLTDVALSADGAELYDVQPGNLPDLFAGQDLTVFGRFRRQTPGPWTMTIAGRRGASAIRYASSVSGGDQARAEYIPTLWAGRKAGALEREIRLHGQTAEITSALKDLAMRYGILTPYTSYLVQEPNVVVMNQNRAPVAAPAPAQQTGAAAVAQSRREAAAARATTLADAVSAAAPFDAPSVERSRLEHAGGRLFVWRNDVWTDLAAVPGTPVVTVSPFSDAYFALLARLPELAEAAKLEPAVLVAGKRVNVKIADGGRERLGADELTQIVKEFRS
jgi:Ca-activated chloride channel family protein